MQGLLIKHIQELAKKKVSRVRWFQVLYVGGRGLAMIDRLLTISGWRKVMNIKQKLAEKELLGLKYKQLIRSHTTARYQKITCIYYENKHSTKISTHSGC